MTNVSPHFEWEVLWCGRRERGGWGGVNERRGREDGGDEGMRDKGERMMGRREGREDGGERG